MREIKQYIYDACIGAGTISALTLMQNALGVATAAVLFATALVRYNKEKKK